MPPEQPSDVAGGDTTPSSASRDDGQQPPERSGSRTIDIAAKSTRNAHDSWLLVGLLLGFTGAVVAVVVVAGRRGGHRLR